MSDYNFKIVQVDLSGVGASTVRASRLSHDEAVEIIDRLRRERLKGSHIVYAAVREEP